MASLRPYRPVVGGVTRNEPDYVTRTKTDHLAGRVREVAQELVLRAAQQTDNALSVDTRWFYYYRRRNVGRTCSCVSGEQSQASATCGICYGSSIVGGYDKYGTWTDVLDCTYPNLDLINVVNRPEPRPSRLVLDPSATDGVVQARIRIRPNAGYVDNLHVAASGSVQITMRGAGSALWIPATSDNLVTLLTAPYMDVRVAMHRSSTKDPSPTFLKLFIRYGLLPASEIQLPGDIPPNTESISLQE